MAKARKSTVAAAVETERKSVDIHRLGQQDAAELLGKPTSWIRDNPHVGGRLGGGFYDGPKLVAGVRQDFVAAELPDADLEPVRQLCEEVIGTLPLAGSAVRLLERLQASHGAAGLAAFAIELLEQCRVEARIEDVSPWQTAADIQEKADRQIAELQKAEARKQGRVVRCCSHCGKYRWGRGWLKPPIPRGYVVDGSPIYCPDCK